MDIKARLLDKRHVSDSGCWEWTGGCIKWGYGEITSPRVVPHRDGKKWRVHRLAYELWVGPIPLGLNVCHHCDNKRCFNPDHLFLGTQADNLADMKAKGRAWAKLTKSDINEIWRLHQAGLSQRTIAARFGVSQPAIGHRLMDFRG